MPATAKGTNYTVTSATVAGAGTVYVGAPDGHTGPIHLVLYCHGAAGAANQFATLGAWTGLRDWLIDNGWAWVEGTGGGSQPWGNPASQTAYDATFAYADSMLTVDKVVVLGRSMGGAVGARVYLAHRQNDARWVGFISNSGVQDLVWAYDWDSGRWTAAFNSAWGVTTKAGFIAAVAGLNPVDGPASAWDGTKVLQMWGSSDTTVTPAANGAAMRTMYAGHPALDPPPDVRVGGDHSATNGSYLQVDAMTAFLNAVTGGGSPVVPPVPSYRIVREYAMLGGLSYPLKLKV